MLKFPHNRGKSWAGAAALAALAFIAYATVYRAGFIWDDDLWVTHNAALRSAAGLWQTWTSLTGPQYYPVTLTSFWVEMQVWGLNPLPYHVANIGLHALNAILAWVILRGLGVRGAWAAAALFAVHPVHVESVAWITERKNVLSGFFTLLTVLAYLRWAGLIGPAEGPREHNKGAKVEAGAGTKRERMAGAPGLYALALGAFLLALLSKTVAATTPAALLVVVWWKRGRITGRDVMTLTPLFALGMGMGLFTAWVERTHIGATGADWALTPLDRALIAGRAVWFYAGKLAWPHPLIFFYPRWEVSAAAWAQWLYPVSAMGALGILWAGRRAWGRGPLAAALIFGGTLFPALGFINVYPMRYTFVADHYQYMASLALLALGAGAGAAGLARVRYGEWIGRVALAAALGAMIVICWREGRHYRDQKTLYEGVIAKNPAAWMAHHNLGKVMSGEGRFEEAAAQFERALRLRPEHEGARLDLGVAQFRLGRLDDAILTFSVAAERAPGKAEPLNNWGNVLLQKKLYGAAVEKYREAIRLNPDFADAHINLGHALQLSGRAGDAAAAYRAGLALRPGRAADYFALGQALQTAGDRAGAAAAYKESLRYDANHAGAKRALERLNE